MYGLVHIADWKTGTLGLTLDRSEVGVGDRGGKVTPLRPSGGAILSSAQAAPNLESLRLMHMRVSRSERHGVLISTGDRLAVFEGIHVAIYS